MTVITLDIDLEQNVTYDDEQGVQRIVVFI